MRRSVCTSQERVAFYWRDAPPGCHVEAAVEELMRALTGPTRWFNPYMKEDLRARFRNLLKKAERGQLRTYHHVDIISRDPEVNLFELRWHDLIVGRIDKASGEYLPGKPTEARLYHVEFEGWYAVVGLHAHEKLISEDSQETKDLQNKQIDIALDRYREGRATRWGIRDLPVEGLDLTTDIR